MQGPSGTLAGLDAGAAGRSWRSCPYDRTRGYSRRAWFAGYVRGRHAAGLPLPGHEGVDEDAVG